MSKYLTLSFSLLFFFIANRSGFAQGCSDAGFCTLNSFKPLSDTTQSLSNHIKLGVAFGGADNDISIVGPYVEFGKQITKDWGVDTKLTSLSQSGRGISTFGLSDLYLNSNFKITQALKFTAGIKIPLMNSNKQLNNLPLPLDYQSSLGTFDLIVGVGYSISNLQLVLALQQPLSQNKNEYLAEEYSIESPLALFQSTNQFKRSGDILLRLSYPFSFADKWILTPSLLPIYHLSEDKFTNITGQEMSIAGSDGLTLNGNIYVDYLVNNNSSIQLNFGTPFIVRDVRPDGLTRSFVVNLEYQYKF